ncbi:YadA family autotransporter adhesin, partial [Xanthomonas albilineans]
NSVSIGDVGNGLTRQITSVAAGTEATDAVNVAQLNVVKQVAAATGQQFKSNSGSDPTTAVGSEVTGNDAIAAGEATKAHGDGASAFGSGALAGARYATASGYNATASGESSTALGGALYHTDASGKQVLDGATTASAVGATALGAAATASGLRSSAMGVGSVATGLGATASGAASSAAGARSTAIGLQTNAIGDNGLAMGYNSVVRRSDGVALGANAGVSADNAVALGAGSRVYQADTVSLGSGDGRGGPATRRIVNLTAGNIALGSAEAINGSQMYQSLSSMAAFLGGGAALGAQGLFVAPTYVIQGGIYHSVGDALTALDSKVSDLAAGSGGDASTARSLRLAAVHPVAAQQAAVAASAAVAVPRAVFPATSVSGSPHAAQFGEAVAVDTVGGAAIGPAARAVDTTGTAIGASAYARGPNDTAIGSNALVNADGSTAVGANSQIAAVATNAVAMGAGASVNATAGTALGQGATVNAQGAVALGQGSVADRAQTVSVGSAGNERQLVNVAAGTQATDAVNKSQLDYGMASAKSYTDARFATMADSFDMLRGDVDARLRDQDRRIDRQGAMSAAMLNMSTSAAGIRTQNRLGAGVGFQNGQSALSVGYQRAFSDRATMTIGGAFSRNDSSVGVGAGFGW